MTIDFFNHDDQQKVIDYCGRYDHHLSQSEKDFIDIIAMKHDCKKLSEKEALSLKSVYEKIITGDKYDA